MNNELVQKSIIKIYTNIDKLHSYDLDSLKGWSYRILKNCFIDSYRTNYHGLTNLEDNFDSFTSFTDNDYNQEEVLERERIVKEVYKEIERLAPRFKLNAQLFFIDNLTHNEIADIMSISISSSKGNILTVKRKLRQKINI